MSRPRRTTPGGGRGARGSGASLGGAGTAAAAARGLAGGGAAGGAEGSRGLRGAFLGRWRRRPRCLSASRLGGGGELCVLGGAGGARSGWAPRSRSGAGAALAPQGSRGSTRANGSRRRGVMGAVVSPWPGRAGKGQQLRRSPQMWDLRVSWMCLETFIPIAFTATVCVTCSSNLPLIWGRVIIYFTDCPEAEGHT